jgi:hypothetical protein
LVCRDELSTEQLATLDPILPFLPFGLVGSSDHSALLPKDILALKASDLMAAVAELDLEALETDYDTWGVAKKKPKKSTEKKAPAKGKARAKAEKKYKSKEFITASDEESDSESLHNGDQEGDLESEQEGQESEQEDPGSEQEDPDEEEQEDRDSDQEDPGSDQEDPDEDDQEDPDSDQEDPGSDQEDPDGDQEDQDDQDDQVDDDYLSGARSVPDSDGEPDDLSGKAGDESAHASSAVDAHGSPQVVGPDVESTRASPIAAATKRPRSVSGDPAEPSPKKARKTIGSRELNSLLTASTDVGAGSERASRSRSKPSK